MRSVFPYSVRMQENTDQEKHRIWAIFMQCNEQGYAKYGVESESKQNQF